MKKGKYGRRALVAIGVLVVVAAASAALGSPLWILPALAAFLTSCTLFGNRS